MKKGFVAIIVAMLMLLNGCSNTNTESYDTVILDNAKEVTTQLGFSDENNNRFITEKRNFNVIKDKPNEFKVNVNGTKMTVQVISNEEPKELETRNVKKVSLKEEKICANSRVLIERYVDNSKILKEKEEIKEFIKEIEVKEATIDDDSTGAYFSDKDEKIYINRTNAAYVCEWMIVHEYIHAISYYTHGCNIKNEQYAFDLFNEILTDIITSGLNPKNLANSGYANYYYLVYPYINLFEEKAIDAYFYGYQDIYDSISSDEFEFFVSVIENYDVENSEAYYNNMIFKWYASKQKKKGVAL